MSTPKTPGELAAAFPDMFPAESRDNISFIRGWFTTFAELCLSIDNVLGNDREQRNFHWIQCKSKFGAARWYFDMKSTAPRGITVTTQQPDGSMKVIQRPTSADALMESIYTLVSEAQERTSLQCEVCGAPATIGNHDGLYATYCPEHTRMSTADQDLPAHYWCAGGYSKKWWQS